MADERPARTPGELMKELAGGIREDFKHLKDLATEAGPGDLTRRATMMTAAMASGMRMADPTRDAAEAVSPG